MKRWKWGSLTLAIVLIPSVGYSAEKTLAAKKAGSVPQLAPASSSSMDAMEGSDGESMAAPNSKSGAASAVAKVENKPAGNLKDQLRKRLRDRMASAGGPNATLPENLDGVAPKPNDDGLTFLELKSSESLGKPMKTAELDALLAQMLTEEGVKKPSPAVADDRFIRRVTLDVIGQLPAPADIEDYVKDRSPDKKAKLIDRLLASPQYGQNWGRYWKDVIAARNTAGDRRIEGVFDFEPWMADQLNRNQPWDQVVSRMLKAEGLSDEVPEGMIYGAHMGKPEEVAGEISRIFLGIQISCAQCHDHKTDTWKRDQFHEFASFFGGMRVRNRQDLREERGRFVLEVASLPRAAYRMPDLEDPKKPGTVMTPVMLTGQPIPMATSDEQRRQAAATFITSKRNPYFAKAYVNRIWSELIGYGFTNPVDDLGADRAVVYPELFERLADSFAASDYDSKELMRLILNSKVYARDSEELEGTYDDSILFGAVIPSRLTADQIFDSVDWILGSVDGNGRQQRVRAKRGPMGVRAEFRQAFGFDPSNDHSQIDGTIPQALTLMNNPRIAARIRADVPGTLLNKLLATRSSDEEVIKALYLRVLARKPTAAEIRTNSEYIKQVGNRQEAYEDILWTLLNTTEFVNNH